MFRKLAVITAVTALGMSAAFAASSVSGTDRTFMMKAAQAGTDEVKINTLAAKKGSTDSVKKLAAYVAEKHQAANQQLMQIAREKNVKLPTTMDRPHAAMYATLSRLSGPAFDKAYLKGQIADHNAAIKLFTSESNRGKDADVKGFASTTLPEIKKHTQMIKDTKAGKPMSSM